MPRCPTAAAAAPPAHLSRSLTAAGAGGSCRPAWQQEAEEISFASATYPDQQGCRPGRQERCSLEPWLSSDDASL
jgi:hypothetical protein